jgi:hypothetical protein
MIRPTPNVSIKLFFDRKSVREICITSYYHEICLIIYGNVIIFVKRFDNAALSTDDQRINSMSVIKVNQ